MGHCPFSRVAEVPILRKDSESLENTTLIKNIDHKFDHKSYADFFPVFVICLRKSSYYVKQYLNLMILTINLTTNYNVT